MKKRIIFSSVVLLLALYSCGKKEPELTPKQIQERADSIVNSKVKALEKQAKEDLAKRLPIEIKPKMDSLRKANFQMEPLPVFPDDGTSPNDTIE